MIEANNYDHDSNKKLQNFHVLATDFFDNLCCRSFSDSKVIYCYKEEELGQLLFDQKSILENDGNDGFYRQPQPFEQVMQDQLPHQHQLQPYEKRLQQRRQRKQSNDGISTTSSSTEGISLKEEKEKTKQENIRKSCSTNNSNIHRALVAPSSIRHPRPYYHSKFDKYAFLNTNEKTKRKSHSTTSFPILHARNCPDNPSLGMK